MENLNDYETKNPTLYKLLIDSNPILPEELEFYKKNMSKGLAYTDMIYEKIQDMLTHCTSLNNTERLALENDIQSVVMDAICECERFHFMYGYKMGARTIMEVLQAD